MPMKDETLRSRNVTLYCNMEPPLYSRIQKLALLSGQDKQLCFISILKENKLVIPSNARSYFQMKFFLLNLLQNLKSVQKGEPLSEEVKSDIALICDLFHNIRIID